MLQRYLFIFFLLFFNLFTATICAAAIEDDANNYIEDLSKKALAIINAKDTIIMDPTDLDGIKKEQALFLENQHKEFLKLVNANFDINFMAQFTLGYKIKTANPDTRDAFIEAYSDYMLTYYTEHFMDYADAKYTVVRIKKEGPDEATVYIQIDAQKSGVKNVGLRVRSNNGQFVIIDLLINGYSVAEAQASNFKLTLQKEGWDGLINTIKNNTQIEKTHSNN